MTATCVNTAATARPAHCISLVAWVMHAWHTNRQRRILANLDDRRLDDLGLSYREAHHEATRPFWDVPAYWLK